jgi:hypothetical protein
VLRLYLGNELAYEVAQQWAHLCAVGAPAELERHLLRRLGKQPPGVVEQIRILPQVNCRPKALLRLEEDAAPGSLLPFEIRRYELMRSKTPTCCFSFHYNENIDNSFTILAQE